MTGALIGIAVIVCVAIATVLLGIVLFLILRRKAVCGKQPDPATGGDTLYDEVDEGQIGTAVTLRGVGELQTITDPDALYEEMDDSEFRPSAAVEISTKISSTDHNAAHGDNNEPSSGVPMTHNTAYGVLSPSSDMPTVSNVHGRNTDSSSDVPATHNAAYGVINPSSDIPATSNVAYGVTIPSSDTCEAYNM